MSDTYYVTWEETQLRGEHFEADSLEEALGMAWQVAHSSAGAYIEFIQADLIQVEDKDGVIHDAISTQGESI